MAPRVARLLTGSRLHEGALEGKGGGPSAYLRPSSRPEGPGERVIGVSKNDLLLSTPLASQSHTNWSRLVLPGQRAQGRKGHGVSGHFLKTDQVPSQNPRPGSLSHHPRAGAGTGAAQLQPLASWSDPQSLELSLLGQGEQKPQGSSVCLNKERGEFAADPGHRCLAKDPSGRGRLAESHALLARLGTCWLSPQLGPLHLLPLCPPQGWDRTAGSLSPRR